MYSFSLTNIKRNMQKLFLILSVLTIVSCGHVESTEIGSTPAETTQTVKVPCIRIDVKNTGYYLYQFKYEGHDYITDYKCSFVYHLSSCSCRSKESILDTNSLFESNSLFND